MPKITELLELHAKREMEAGALTAIIEAFDNGGVVTLQVGNAPAISFEEKDEGAATAIMCVIAEEHANLNADLHAACTKLNAMEALI